MRNFQGSLGFLILLFSGLCLTHVAGADELLDRILSKPHKFVVVQSNYKEFEKGALSGWTKDSPDHLIDLKDWIRNNQFMGSAKLKKKNNPEYHFVAKGPSDLGGRMLGTIIREDVDAKKIQTLVAECQVLLAKE